MDETLVDLNRALAERLFGAVIYDDPRGGKAWQQKFGPRYQWPAPDYAGTWEGLGLVLEAMRARGYYWKVGTDLSQAGMVTWATFWLDGKGPSGEAEAFTPNAAPEAVAKAALASLQADA